jgi:hypothetical protein
MAHKTHERHEHHHGAGCGHRAVQHAGHTDYLHDGHLHHEHAGHVDECSLEAAGMNQASCTPQHACGEHAKDHRHGAGCGHELVPHGDHNDYLVGGHLHSPHGQHCDDHGAISLA